MTSPPIRNSPSLALAVSSWFPYRYQAAAFQQLLGGVVIEITPLEDKASPLHDASLGPFLILGSADEGLPLAGITAIGEALHRAHPERGLLGHDRVSRAQVRALAAMIEERFSRFCISAIGAHTRFEREIWHPASAAPDRVLDTPPPFETIEKHMQGTMGRFVVGDTPTLADSLLAALWWTAEDLGQSSALIEMPTASAWYRRNCSGDPFRRPSAP